MSIKARKEHSRDILFLTLLTFLFVILSIIFFQKQGFFDSDMGREAYIAEQVMNGTVLYKGILNIYGPLSYQINAVLFKLFGVHLNTLFIAGTFIAYGITLCIYFISRLFTTELLSFSLASFTTILGIANLNAFNFVFPYTFAMTYSLLGVLLSLLFLLKHFYTSKWYFLTLSFFFIGFSITSKLDFVGCLFLLMFYSLFIRKSNLKYHLYNLLALAIIPLLSWGTLFLQGLTLNNIPELYTLYTKIISSKGSQTFFKFAFSLYPTENLFNGLKTNGLFIIFLLTQYKMINKFGYKLPVILLIFLMDMIIANLIFYNSFQYIAILTLILLIFMLIKNINKLNKIENFDLSFILLLSFSLLIASRNILNIIPMTPYGSYPLPILLACVILFAGVYIPNKLEFKNKDIPTITLATLLLFICGLIAISAHLNALEFKSTKISTPKGTIYVAKTEYNKQKELLSVASGLPKDEELIIWPESTMTIFLADKKTDPFYFIALSPFIEAYGEDRIINDMKKKTKTTLLILLDQSGANMAFGTKGLCVDYGQKLCSLLKQKKLFKHEKRTTK